MSGQPPHRPRGSSTAATKVRKRVPVSCMSCRVRKLKCDRSEPCYNCLQRNEECSYAPDARPGVVVDSKRGTLKANVQDRVRHLEALVISLMQERDQYQKDPSSATSTKTPPHAFDPNDSPTGEKTTSPRSDSSKSGTAIVPLGASGRILHQEGQNYVNPEHWTAILEDIAEVREYLGSDSQEISPEMMELPPVYDEPYLLMAQSQTFDRIEILGSIPPKVEADQLVFRYLNARGPTRLLIHGPTFMKEYERFWIDPDSASDTWVGLLFGVLCMAVGFQRRQREPLPPALEEMGDVASLFRVRCAQCLLNAVYARPTKYTLETLIVYAFIEFVRNKDTPISASLIVEITIQMAFRAGYHRDPSHFPNLTPFEREMRRRIWANCYIMDLSMSFDVGKPRAINDAYCDTQEPANYAEEDFDEQTQEFPAPRSDDEPSNISYHRVKLHMTQAFAHIYDANNRITPSTYDEVLRLDRELRDVYENLPAHMQLESRELRNIELSQALIWQYNINMDYQRARCVLHRPYTFGLDSSDRQNFSRDMCQEAAIEMLKYQYALQQHLEPGGALHKQWFFTAQETQNSILAAMLICRDLSMGKPGSPTAVDSNDAKERQRREEQIKWLENTCLIWSNLKDTSGNAYKAYLVVREVLRKVKPQMSQTPTEATAPSTGAQVSSYEYSNPPMGSKQSSVSPPSYGQAMGGMQLPPMQPQQWGYPRQSQQLPTYTTAQQYAAAPQVTQMPTSTTGQYPYMMDGQMDANNWGLYRGPIYNGVFGTWQPPPGYGDGSDPPNTSLY